MKCESTVHNNTKEHVYAIVTNRSTKTTTTANKGVKVGIPAAATEGGLEHTKQVEKGPTPTRSLQLVPKTIEERYQHDLKEYFDVKCVDFKK